MISKYVQAEKSHYRIKLRPLIKEIPFFSNLVVSFVSPPEINFDLGGVANLLDFPGLVEVAKSAAMESLSTIVVLPRGIAVPMVEQGAVEEQVGASYHFIDRHSIHMIHFRSPLPGFRTCSCSRLWL